nr:SHOCT domain-containing protein [Sedimentibacter sp.]
MLLIWVVIGLIIYYLYKNNANLNIKHERESSAEAILKQRYVKGEIDDDTFEKMMKIIKDR